LIEQILLILHRLRGFHPWDEWINEVGLMEDTSP